MQDLSPYEIARLERIKENERTLQELGIATAAAALREAATPEKRAIDPAIRAARAQERQERLLEAQANRRASSRLAGAPATPIKRYSDEFANDSDDEDEAIHRRAKKRARASGGGAGRGGKAGAAMAALSEAERAALAEAYEEVSTHGHAHPRPHTPSCSAPSPRAGTST